MMKHRASLVQQVVCAEFDTTTNHPSQGSIVMVNDVMHEEGVVGSSGNLRGREWEMRFEALAQQFGDGKVGILWP